MLRREGGVPRRSTQFPTWTQELFFFLTNGWALRTRAPTPTMANASGTFDVGSGGQEPPGEDDDGDHCHRVMLMAPNATSTGISPMLELTQ